MLFVRLPFEEGSGYKSSLDLVIDMLPYMLCPMNFLFRQSQYMTVHIYLNWFDSMFTYPMGDVLPVLAILVPF